MKLRHLLPFLLLLGCGSPEGDQLPGSENPSNFEDFQLHIEDEFVYRDLVDGPEIDDHVHQSLTLPDRDSARRFFGEQGRALLEYPDPFQQVGLRLLASSVEDLSFRSFDEETQNWGAWEKVEIYWTEGALHNGLILTEKPVQSIELRGGESIEFAHLEFFDTIRARPVLLRSHSDGQDLRRPVESEEEDLRSLSQAVAPSSLVTSRAGWGATNPNKICGNVIAPYRMAIHHTAVPSSDGNLYATMRGMQNYHMNNNGWCDIGYHFVVAQSGEILQGRSRTNRPGAHVGNQNAGNVGISLIGNYSSANPPQIQVNQAGAIVRWVHHAHDVPLNRTAIKGHREWPGQTTSCPGNQGLARINEIISIAQSGGSTPPPPPPPPPQEYDASLDVRVSGLQDFYTQGTSNGVSDAFAGERFSAEVRLTNESDEPIRGVRIGVEVGEEFRVHSYSIETDHPTRNQSSWTLNDANDAPENPGSIDSSAVLTMYAFSPGETKRVVLEMEARSYNIAENAIGVRAWVENIDNLYGQASYGASPSRNELGYSLQEHQRVDILARDKWLFQAGGSEDLEGWTAEGAVDQLLLNTSHSLLALKVEAPGAALYSPEWTSVDADRYSEAVLRVRSHDGRHEKSFYWARDGEEFSNERRVTFKVDGDSEYHLLVLPLGDHPDWTGNVERIRLVMNRDLELQEESSGWYDLDYLFFQDQEQQVSTSPTLGVVGREAYPITFGSDGSSGSPISGGISFQPDEVTVKTNKGCSSTSGSSGEGTLVSLLLVGLLVAIRRRAKGDANLVS